MFRQNTQRSQKGRQQRPYQNPPDYDDHQQQAVPGNPASESVDNTPEDPIVTYQGDTDEYTFHDAEGPVIE